MIELSLLSTAITSPLLRVPCPENRFEGIVGIMMAFRGIRQINQWVRDLRSDE
jgi:hypothetical protein